MRKIIAVLMVLFFAALCLPFDAKAQNEGRVAEIKEAIRGHREAIRQLKAELHALIGPPERGAAPYVGEAEEEYGEKVLPPHGKPDVKPPLSKGPEEKKRWLREKAKGAEKPPLKGRGPGLAPAPGKGKGLERERRETPGRGPGLKAAPGKGPAGPKGAAGPQGGDGPRGGGGPQGGGAKGGGPKN